MPTPTPLGQVLDAARDALLAAAASHRQPSYEAGTDLSQRLAALAYHVSARETWEVQGRRYSSGQDAPWEVVGEHALEGDARYAITTGNPLWEYRLVPVHTLTARVTGPVEQPIGYGADEPDTQALADAEDAAAHLQATR